MAHRWQCPSLIPISKQRFFILLAGLVVNVVLFSVLELSPLINGTMKEVPAFIHEKGGHEANLRLIQALNSDMEIIEDAEWAQAECDNEAGCQWLQCYLNTTTNMTDQNKHDKVPVELAVAAWTAFHFVHPHEYCANALTASQATEVEQLVQKGTAWMKADNYRSSSAVDTTDTFRTVVALDKNFNVIHTNYTFMFECTSEVDCRTLSCQMIHLMDAYWIAVHLRSPVQYCQNLQFTQHIRLSMSLITSCVGLIVILSMGVLQGIATHRVGQLALQSKFYPSAFSAPYQAVHSNSDEDGLADPMLFTQKYDNKQEEYQRLALDSSSWSLLNLAFFIAYAILWVNACFTMMLDCVHTWPARLARVALLSWAVIILSVVSAFT